MNRNLYREQVRAAVRAIHVTSRGTCEWLHSSISSRVVAKWRANRSDALIQTLTAILYQNFYCPGQPTPYPRAARAVLDHRLISELSAANRAPAFVDWGWRTQAAVREMTLATKGRITIRLQPAEVLSDPQKSTIGVRLPSSYANSMPGFYSVLGAGGPGAKEGIARIYWNLEPRGRVRLLSHLSQTLTDAAIPFALKTFVLQEGNVRCDSSVLYVAAGDQPQWRPIVDDAYNCVSDTLRDGWPALTKRLGRGLALAEDPGGDTSFGEHRCGLLAKAVAKGHADGEREHDLMLAVEAAFMQAGLNLDRPYLSPNSQDVYEPMASSRRKPCRGETPVLRSGDLAEAVEIGRVLAKRAIRWDGRATWVGVAMDATAGGPATFGTLGPTIYDGLGGVVAFLTQLWCATEDAEFRTLAIAAARQALVRMVDVPMDTRLGFYAGWTGTLAAVGRLGRLCDEGMLVADVRRKWNRLERQVIAGSEFDVVSGLAGGILGALCLAEALDDCRFRTTACKWATALVNASVQNAHGACWKSSMPTFGPLLGFSHGAGGAAYALLTIHRVCPDPAYLHTAQAALAYEQTRYDPVHRNWPDLRKRTPLQRDHGYSIYWCHGAPGEALPRLLALEVTQVPEYRQQAEIALATTAAELQRLGSAEQVDMSLCHGMSGLAVIVREGLAAIPNGKNDTLLREIRFRLIDHLRAAPNADLVPNLMLGHLGVAYAILQLARPEVPSVLKIRPEQWTGASSARIVSVGGTTA